MLTTKEYMDDLKFLGELAKKMGMETEFQHIFDAYQIAKQEYEKDIW